MTGDSIEKTDEDNEQQQFYSAIMSRLYYLDYDADALEGRLEGKEKADKMVEKCSGKFCEDIAKKINQGDMALADALQITRYFDKHHKGKVAAGISAINQALVEKGKALVKNKDYDDFATFMEKVKSDWPNKGPSRLSSFLTALLANEPKPSEELIKHTLTQIITQYPQDAINCIAAIKSPKIQQQAVFLVAARLADRNCPPRDKQTLASSFMQTFKKSAFKSGETIEKAFTAEYKPKFRPIDQLNLSILLRANSWADAARTVENKILRRILGKNFMPKNTELPMPKEFKRQLAQMQRVCQSKNKDPEDNKARCEEKISLYFNVLLQRAHCKFLGASEHLAQSLNAFLTVTKDNPDQRGFLLSTVVKYDEANPDSKFLDTLNDGLEAVVTLRIAYHKSEARSRTAHGHIDKANKIAKALAEHEGASAPYNSAGYASEEDSLLGSGENSENASEPSDLATKLLGQGPSKLKTALESKRQRFGSIVRALGALGGARSHPVCTAAEMELPDIGEEAEAGAGAGAETGAGAEAEVSTASGSGGSELPSPHSSSR